MVIRLPQGDDHQSRVDECENFIIRDIIGTKQSSNTQQLQYMYSCYRSVAQVGQGSNAAQFNTNW